MKWIMWFVAIVNVSASTALALVGVNKLHTIFDKRDWLLYAAAVVAGLTALAQPYAVNLGEKRRAQQLSFERAVHDMITAALVQISRSNPQLDVTKIGVHAFLITRRFYLHRWGLSKFIQQSVATAKLTRNPPPTGIPWTEGKGVVGRCWSERKNVYVDIRNHYKNMHAISSTEWEKLPVAQSLGLTFDEFQRTKDYFGIVAAVPVICGKDYNSKYLGCISFDTPFDFSGAVDQHSVEDGLRFAAVTLETFLEQKK